jgi:hypothetical protein
MDPAQAFRLREQLPALRVAADAHHPVYVRLEPGTLVLVVGDLSASGLVDVASATDRYTVFAEDLLSRAEPVLTRVPPGASAI